MIIDSFLEWLVFWVGVYEWFYLCISGGVMIVFDDLDWDEFEEKLVELCDKNNEFKL